MEVFLRWQHELCCKTTRTYMLISKQYGIDALNKVIRNPHNINGIFQCSELELHKKMVEYIKK